MVLNCILGALAGLSVALLLWQWVAARRFPLHRRSAEHRLGRTSDEMPDLPGRCPAFRPGVTLLKPLKGADQHTAMCLRSWLTQDYAGPVQVLFGVAAADDPACAVVRKLLAEFPEADAQLVVCPEQLGANAKVSKLIQLERLAKHELICVSDADVRVPVDFLVEAVVPLTPSDGESILPTDRSRVEPLNRNAGFIRQAEGARVLPDKSGVPRRRFMGRVAEGREKGGAALVNCFYRLANPTTFAMQCEAVAINADFWSQVLQSCSLKPMDFALGAVMLTRRSELAGMGNFAAIKDCLADDYQLGNRIAKRGGRIEICPVVVECWDAPAGWAAVWKHQLRWARTIRVCQPMPYFFSILSNPTFWPLLWAAVERNWPALSFLGAALLVRLLVTADLQRRLARGQPTPNPSQEGNSFWLAPLKDILHVAVWALAFAGNTIEWRGRRMKLRRDGTLIPA